LLKIVKVMLKNISTDKITLGMYIHALGGSWMDHPFWKKRFLLKDTKDLVKLRNSPVKEVTIDTMKYWKMM